MDHPDYKLMLVANRDEYYKRPSTPLHKWNEGFFAGKDLKEGGTWLGFHPSGRFAALTNFRDYENERDTARSRGELVSGFLDSDLSPIEYLQEIESKKHLYNGFNLIVAERDTMCVFSNYKEGIDTVGAGLHAISNSFLDTPWPKVISAKADFRRFLLQNHRDVDSYLGLLQSKTLAPDSLLPETGLPFHLEKAVSSQFIHVDDYYGTVNTTVVLWKHDGEVIMKERKWVPELEESVVAFAVKDQCPRNS
jgi:uncharacterized protein with NRDE domain